mgnify:CR=1 FL=1
MGWPENMGSTIEQADDDKSEHKTDWDMCVHFLAGNHWLNYDRGLRRYEVARPREGDSTLVTVNLVLNIYRNILSRLSINYPSMAVVPSASNPEDSTKAKSMELLLQYHWMEDELKDTITDMIRFLLSCGTSALHTFYDPDKERVRTEVVSPYDLFWEQGVQDPADSEWCAIRSYHTKRELKDAYPDFEQEIEDAATTSLHDGGMDPDVPEGRVKIYEVYWKSGKHAILLKNDYLFKEEDYPVDPFPVQVVRYSKIPTRAWGLGLIQPLVELNWFYNKARSALIMNVETMSNPKWLVPRTAGIDNHAFTDKPGEKIHYNAAGGEPKMVQPVPLPGYVLDNLTRIQAEMGDVAGIHSVSLGKRAVNVSSGSAINALAERDMSQLQITQSDIEKCVRKSAKVMVRLMKAHYTSGKMIRMMDDLGGVIYKQLENTDILEDPEVFLQAGSLFRNEAHDRDAKVLQMLELGLIDKQTAMKEISFRTSNQYASDKVKAIAHAEEMLFAAVEGAMITIFANEDLESYEYVWKEFMRSSDFYALPEERRNYISDVYVSIITHGRPEQEYQQALFRRQVFPRQQSPQTSPEAMGASLIDQQSPMAFNQLLNEQINTAASKGTLEDAVSRQAQRKEALISPVKGGF